MERVKGDVRYGALSNPLLNRVLKQFGPIAFKRCSIMMEFEHFLRAIGASGRTCLEIGTFNGISAVLLSQYFERVVCVSVDDSPKTLLKNEIIEFLGIKNVRFFDVRTEDEKREIVRQFEFDFAYLDGNHQRDTLTDFEMTRHCGRILFHEYWPLQPSVWNLVNGLPPSEVRRAQFDCFAYWERPR